VGEDVNKKAVTFVAAYYLQHNNKLWINLSCIIFLQYFNTKKYCYTDSNRNMHNYCLINELAILGQYIFIPSQPDKNQAAYPSNNHC